MWGRSERVIVTSGLSKAYGLPGLRIGWIVGPPSRMASLWSYHDYTTIAPGALNDALARRALEPAHARAAARAYARHPEPQLSDHRRLARRARAMFSYAPPDAGAIVYARYHHAINSTELVTRLRVEKSVLIVPGDHFGMDHYLRLGFGDNPDHLQSGTRPPARSPVLDLILIGYGNVARRFASLLDEQRDTLSRDYGLRARIVGIATRRHGQVYGGPEVVSGFSRTAGPPEGGRYRKQATLSFLRDALTRSAAAARQRRLVVIETTTLDIASRRAGDRPRPRRAGRRRARDHRQQGTGRRSRIARCARAAQRADRRFLFEGAVMDGVPIFNLVRETLPAVRSARLPRRGQQHDELHPHRDGSVGSRSTRRSPRCRRAASPRPTRRSTSTAGTRQPRPRRWPTCCWARASRRRDVDRRGIGPDTGLLAREARAAGTRLKLVARAERQGRRIVGARRARGASRRRSAGRARGPTECAHPEDGSARGNRHRAARRQPDADRLRAAVGPDHHRPRQRRPPAWTIIITSSWRHSTELPFST